MSLDEAKQVTASFSGFTVPPRTIEDIAAILDQQKHDHPDALVQARALADQPPPRTTDAAVLADFYYRRGVAAHDVGRTRQEIEDLTQAARFAPAGHRHPILRELGVAEALGGSTSRSLAVLRQGASEVGPNEGGWTIGYQSIIARLAALAGDLDAADAALREAQRAYYELSRAPLAVQRLGRVAANVATAEASVLELRGKLGEAEGLARKAVAAAMTDSLMTSGIRGTTVDIFRARLALVIARQGRLVEAEALARATLLEMLRKRGRNAVDTAFALALLARIITMQGRAAEGEALGRSVLEIYQTLGASPDSFQVALVRDQLGAALIAQRRWPDALREYEAMHAALATDQYLRDRLVAGNVNWALALMGANQPGRACDVLKVAYARQARLLGPRHAGTAQTRVLMGLACFDREDRLRALREIRDAVATLLTGTRDVDDESVVRPARDQQLAAVLSAYIRLLADTRGTALEREAGIDAAAEAFQVADAARGRSVQRALDAGAARAAATTPALADLVRREQDAAKQIGALYGLLTNASSLPTAEQDPRVIADLQARITALQEARRALNDQVARDFPAYDRLINPAPASVAQARAVLRPGEALVSTFVTGEQTFVWAIPPSGPIAFAVVPLGEAALAETVAHLRKALDPSARRLGDIPEFDVARAHELYRALLEPVKDGWRGASSLLVVAHGPLGQLPLALLPTTPTTLGTTGGPLFADYRTVPWLIRTHAVTALPSVTSLVTLRALRPGDPARRPFVGFGDPLFSAQDAARASAAGRTASAAGDPVATRGTALTIRSVPRTREASKGGLELLPRLPETAEEVRSMALATGADVGRDVFTGRLANEKTIQTVPLRDYRVIAFATHGLVAGDLDGLTQPALALTAPDVAQVEGDGLLTMDEILALRLDADWVVLSACNTASSNGEGAEAVSGLGRAFFYAGARALLVTSWPVETTSAQTLTTDLFRRQRDDPALTGAQALQHTMNSLIDKGVRVDPSSRAVLFSYAHPIFWAAFTLVGEGGRLAGGH
jgi:CHAT domain-containing protein